MVQMRGGLRFIAKALKLTRIDSAGKRQNLEGDAPAQRNLLRLIHDSHAAAADLTQQSIITELTKLAAYCTVTVHTGSVRPHVFLPCSLMPGNSSPRSRRNGCTP